MNKVELLGHSAIEYAAQQVVTERAAANELRDKIAGMNIELMSLREQVSSDRRYKYEKQSLERRSAEFLDRVADDLAKIRDAWFWQRREMVRDLLDKAYWIRR